MMTMFEGKYIRRFMIFTLALGLAGCGYRAGSLMHPQVKTIAVAPVGNETLVPLCSSIMRQQLVEQFQFDNSLRIKGLKEADCVLHGKVLEVNTTAVSEDSWDNEMTYRAAEWEVEVVFEYSVIIPGRKQPLVGPRKVKGKASYQVLADYNITRRRGIQQACRNAAERVVILVTEGW